MNLNDTVLSTWQASGLEPQTWLHTYRDIDVDHMSVHRATNMRLSTFPP